MIFFEQETPIKPKPSQNTRIMASSLSASLPASCSMMFPATAALEQYQKNDNSSFPEITFPADCEFGTDSMFDQILAMESPFAQPFPTIAWPSEEATPSVSNNTSTTRTKKSLHKAMRRAKHRSMIRCKSYHRSLSELRSTSSSLHSEASFSSLSDSCSSLESC